MDSLLRLLPIIVVLLFALIVNPYQSADAQISPQVVPLQFNYQSGSANEIYTDSEINQNPVRPFRFNGFWLLVILAIPATYFIWTVVRTKIEELLISREPVGRGYSISYQDIRRSKKRTFKTIRKPRVL